MNNTIDRAIILIDKYHSGIASEEELASLNKWKNSSKQNAHSYNEFISLLEIIKNLGDWKQFDNGRAWSKLQSRIGSRGLRISRQIMSAAAILLLVLAATIWNFAGSDGEKSMAFLSGSDAKFTVLQDGSELFLSENAKIYTAGFSDDSRFLKTEGSYFVNVSRNEDSPFTLKTDRISIKVLGTSFKVEEKEDHTLVKVREGKVLITSADGTAYTLSKDEQFSMKGNDIAIGKVQNEDWGLHTKTYNDESLFNLVNDLAAKYGNLKINASSISPTCKITTKISKSTIIEILKELDLIFDVDYTIKNGIITVENISC